MKIRFLLLISFSGFVLAFVSFKVGLSVFAERSQAIHEKKEASGSETVYLGELEHATEAARTGIWIAGILLLISIFIFARVVPRIIEHKRQSGKNCDVVGG